MDFLFNKKYTYLVNESIDNVRENIQAVLSRKWYNFSSNLTGRIRPDGSYILTPKMAFSNINWFESSPAYLRVKLSREGDKTKIETLVRPNSGLVIIFYLLILIFGLELVGVNVFEGPKVYSLLFLPLFVLIIFGLITVYPNTLKRKFEKIIGQ